MKYSEMFTWEMQYCKETIYTNGSILDLRDEVTLFKKHYPNAIVDINEFGKVRISYANKRLAEGAAKAFQHAVTRFDWWKEL